MKPLLSPAGLAALDAVLADRPLIAFDFDGTLAPLVDRPEDSRVMPALEPRLARLTELADVAIITGRALGNLRPLVTFDARHLIGNHGAEGGPLATAPGAGALAADGAALIADLRTRLTAAGSTLAAAEVRIEDKGASMALHYRGAADPAAARATIAAVLDGHDPGIEVYGGKDVVNLVVAAAPDKGRALLALVDAGGYRAAVFAGDDVNDESVFRRAPSGWVTVRVGDDEADSAARWSLESIEQMPAFVDQLLARLER